MSQHPLVFEPVFFSRIWGGRRLATLFHRELPDDGENYGESWEISDRPECDSVVKSGVWKGRSLHQLWTMHREEIFGKGYDLFERFPLICKILDARDTLSVQVHPPAGMASALGGEPKTEAWYIVEADPGSRIYAGWKRNVSRQELQDAVQKGYLQDLIGELSPRTGESLSIPSGRVHALGAGIMVYEIQQNSDTTYRLYDWNRVDDRGQTRELHIPQALASLTMNDVEPRLRSPGTGDLVSSPEFHLYEINLEKGEMIVQNDWEHFALLIVAEGSLVFDEYTAQRGDFLILPRHCSGGKALENTRVLFCTVPFSAP